jgi:RNA polymerase sigma-70 factor (ECF subfamily)
MDPDLRTVSLHDLIARHRAGDAHALDVLVRRTGDRLTALASAMLRDYPQVRAREETGDVLQNAVLRLMRALTEATPASVRDYYRLAAELIRRELRDLARWHARRPAEPLPDAGDSSAAAGPPAPSVSRDLDLWAELQEAVEALPGDLREVFSLTFYHGWTQPEIAELLGTNDRQVRRIWVRACRRLRAAVDGDLPIA